MPAQHNLLSIFLGDELDGFMRHIFSSQYRYDLARAGEITETFMNHIPHIPRLYSTVDLDDYFRATYQFLVEQPEAVRPTDVFMRQFWEDYSLTSRLCVLTMTAAKLELAETTQHQAADRYGLILKACMSGEMMADNEEYQMAMKEHQYRSWQVRMFCKYSNQAAMSRKHAVYQCPRNAWLTLILTL